MSPILWYNVRESNEQCQGYQKADVPCLHGDRCFFDNLDRAKARDEENIYRNRGEQYVGKGMETE